MSELKTFAVKVCWDRDNDCDLDGGLNAADDEKMPALKVGPLVLIWGVERNGW